MAICHMDCNRVFKKLLTTRGNFIMWMMLFMNITIIPNVLIICKRMTMVLQLVKNLRLSFHYKFS